MSITVDHTATDVSTDVRDNAQGAFFALGPQCVECNRRFVRLGALRCDPCTRALAGVEGHALD